MALCSARLQSVLIFVAVLIATSSTATMYLPGSTFLDSFSDIGLNRSVVVATVVGVENRSVGQSAEREQLRPQMILSVEEVLWGTYNADSPVFAGNTFLPSVNHWSLTVVTGRAWVLPGQRVLLLLEYHDEFSVEGATTIAAFAKVVRFIGAGALADSSSVFSQASAWIDREAVARMGMDVSLEEVLGSVSVEFEDTGYDLGDIRSALPKE